MKLFNRNTVLAAAMGLTMTAASTVLAAPPTIVNLGDPAAGLQAADVIATSTTWTADKIYNLRSTIYVQPGATLTIEPGTIVASQPTVNGAGTLVITPGAKIFALGTKDKPVIMTSWNDIATWTGSSVVTDGNGNVTQINELGDPKTGTWRAAANEWGNLTILGKGLVSGSKFGGADITITIDNDGVPDGAVTDRINTAIPDGLNKRVMEGLVAAFTGDPNILYGGNDDEDSSGSLRYVSIRYTGRVVGLGNELNGLSMGGVGRGTDISHVEIMNNVDDGVEIWGGKVSPRYISIWNIGDDSFDIDQGWRGKAQFVFIVQGYSVGGLDGVNPNAGKSGSGVGDNAIEHDGAEDSDAQPQTTGVLANVTVIGHSPLNTGGSPQDGLTAWRDNCNMQYYNSIFMFAGGNVVKFDDDDGDGANGYGHNGTLSWPARWTTAFDAAGNFQVNAAPGTQPGDFNHPDTMYDAQTQGNLIGFYNNIFYSNGAAYGQAENVGGSGFNLFSQGNNHKEVADNPIVSVTRAAPELLIDRIVRRVTKIDPRASSALAKNVGGTAPDDGFFAPVPYAGAFSADNNWAAGWSASSRFGFYEAAAVAQAGPSAAIQLLFTAVSFQTENNVVYTVEVGEVRGDVAPPTVVWTPIATITGDGSSKSIADVLGVDFVANKLYRVIAN